MEGLVSVDNRRGTKKQKRASPNKDDANTYGDDETAGSSFVFAEDSVILRKALEYLDSESLEKARQKHLMLSCLRIRDEISSLKGQVNSASRRFYHAKEGSPQADSLMEKLEALEATLHERKQYLSFLQNEEADRQLKVIGERALIRAASAAPIAAPSVDSNQQSMLLVKNGKECLTTPARQRTPLSGLVTFASPLKSPAEAMLFIAQNEVLVSVECRIIIFT